jgi:ABC-type multidrug transport system ATPase subunit
MDVLAEIASMVYPLRQRRVAFLSFGQRRSVELLRVLSSQPNLLLLDEPLNFLDSGRRGIVVRSIQGLAATGVQIVITTHYDEDFQLEGVARYTFSSDLPAKALVAR